MNIIFIIHSCPFPGSSSASMNCTDGHAGSFIRWTRGRFPCWGFNVFQKLCIFFNIFLTIGSFLHNVQSGKYTSESYIALSIHFSWILTVFFREQRLSDSYARSIQLRRTDLRKFGILLEFDQQSLKFKIATSALGSMLKYLKRIRNTPENSRP